jgi:hypothetical protein
VYLALQEDPVHFASLSPYFNISREAFWGSSAGAMPAGADPAGIPPARVDPPADAACYLGWSKPIPLASQVYVVCCVNLQVRCSGFALRLPTVIRRLRFRGA